MPALNVWMPTFDDLPQLRKAIASTQPYADDIKVYVVDGRYATFEGAHDLSPGAKAHCREHAHVEYVHPPELPLGNPDAPDEFRSPQHEQAKWVNYELLPQDEWAMEMDTDERIESFSADALSDLDGTYKWSPTVLNTDDEQLKPAIRVYKPRHWTFWIDDVMFWRDHYPRDTPLKTLCKAHATSAHRNTNYGGVIDDITIRNWGTQRPEEYQERRADQLETMGVEWAAQAVRDGKNPSTIDLATEYGGGDE